MSKKSKAKKIFLKVLCVLLCLIVAFIAIITAVSAIGDSINFKNARTFETVSYKNQLVPEKDENGYWYFTTDEDFKILHLTDVHLGGGFMSINKDKMTLNAVAAMVTAEKPDLVVVTGDITFPVPFQAGTMNNKIPSKMFAELMESLGVYWTMTMGNHDQELYSYYSIEKIGDLYESEDYEHCLFQKGPDDIDGCGNYYINVKNSEGIITQTLYMLDSHSYIDGDFLGIQWKYDNIHQNQIDWYVKTVDALNAENDAVYKSMNSDEKSDIKSLMFFHIPIGEQKEAWDEYAANGYQDTENARLIYGAAGEHDRVVYCGEHEDNLFETILEKESTKGIFFGHDHHNGFSMDYKGIRLTYGLTVDYLAYYGATEVGSQRGCTVINVAQNGNFDCRQENYYQDKYAARFEKETVTMQKLDWYRD